MAPDHPQCSQEQKDGADMNEGADLNKSVMDLRERFASFEGRFGQKLDDQGHDIKHILQKIDTYAPRREIDEKMAAAEEKSAARDAVMGNRLEGLESTHRWVARGVFGAWISGALVVIFGKKLFGP